MHRAASVTIIHHQNFLNWRCCSDSSHSVGNRYSPKCFSCVVIRHSRYFLLIQKADNLWNLFIQEVVPKLRAISQRCMMNHIERQLVAVSKLQFTFLRIRVVDFFIQLLDRIFHIFLVKNIHAIVVS